MTLKSGCRERFAPAISAETVVVCSGVAGAIVILIIVVMLLMKLRSDATTFVQQSARNMLELIELDVRRNTDLYDLAIKGVIEAEAAEGASSLPAETHHALKFSRVATTRFMGGLIRLDASGSVIAESAQVTPRRRNFSDRGYFVNHQNSADLGLSIGPPIAGRMNDPEWRITFSRRVSRRDGSFDGVVVGGMRIAYFDQLFAPLEIGKLGAISIIRTDGIVVRDEAQGASHRWWDRTSRKIRILFGSWRRGEAVSSAVQRLIEKGASTPSPRSGNFR